MKRKPKFVLKVIGSVVLAIISLPGTRDDLHVWGQWMDNWPQWLPPVLVISALVWFCISVLEFFGLRPIKGLRSIGVSLIPGLVWRKISDSEKKQNEYDQSKLIDSTPTPYDLSHYDALQFVLRNTGFGISGKSAFQCAWKIIELAQEGKIKIWASYGTQDRTHELIPVSKLSSNEVTYDLTESTLLSDIRIETRPDRGKAGVNEYYFQPKFSLDNLESAFRMEPDWCPLEGAINWIITKTRLGSGKDTDEVFNKIRKYAIDSANNPSPIIQIRGFYWNPMRGDSSQKNFIRPEAVDKSIIPPDDLRESVFVRHGPKNRRAVKVEYKSQVHSRDVANVVRSQNVYYDPETQMRDVKAIFGDKS